MALPFSELEEALSEAGNFIRVGGRTDGGIAKASRESRRSIAGRDRQGPRCATWKYILVFEKTQRTKHLLVLFLALLAGQYICRDTILS